MNEIPNPSAINTPEELRQLDGLIALAFDGYWTRTPQPGVVEYCRRDGEKIRFGGLETMVPRYSTSKDEAVALLERFQPGIWWIIGKGRMNEGEPEYGCQLQFGRETLVTAEGTSAPLAVIAAMILLLPDGTLNEARRVVAQWFALQGDEG